MHPQLLSSAAVALLSCSVLGCGAPEPLQKRALGVLGGSQTGQAQPSVVYVTAEVATIGGSVLSKIGSGTLVAPNLVATALHVVSRNPSDRPFTCDTEGNEVSGSSGSLLGPPVAPEKVSIYAGPFPDTEAVPLAVGAAIVSTGSPTICKNDLAFIVLDQAVDLPTVPVHRGDRTQVGDVLTAVGFGGDPMAELVSRTERDVDVTAVGQWVRTFTVSEGPCEGDSGGPALSQQGEIVGVFSSVATDCEGANAAAKYTDLSYFAPLVEDAFEAAGAGSPWRVEGSGGQASGGEANGGEANAGASQAGSPPADEERAHDDSGCALALHRSPRVPSALLLTYALALLGRLVSARKRPGAARAARVVHPTARVV